MAPFILRSNGRINSPRFYTPTLCLHFLNLQLYHDFACRLALILTSFFDDSRHPSPPPTPLPYFSAFTVKEFTIVPLSCPEHYTQKIYDPIICNNISYDESKSFPFSPPFPLLLSGGTGTLYTILPSSILCM